MPFFHPAILAVIFFLSCQGLPHKPLFERTVTRLQLDEATVARFAGQGRFDPGLGITATRKTGLQEFRWNVHDLARFATNLIEGAKHLLCEFTLEFP